MGKKNTKKDSASSKVVERKEPSDIKEEKVSAIGRYMKKVRAHEKTTDDQEIEKRES